jgi:hypothetical protein
MLKAEPGRKFQITVKRAVTRTAAARTLERLFMKDKAVAGPIDVRTRQFADKPKRRGGRIWTKRPNKLHPPLKAGSSATVLATAQHARDLDSVADFVDVATV